MRHIKNLFLPLALFLFAFILRLEFISRGPFNEDALRLAVNAQKTLDTLRLHYIQTPGSPLTVIIAAINIAISRFFSINDSVLVVNFMSVYFGALAVLMLYLSVKELLNELSAVFSALFFTVLPPYFSASLFGKDHTLSIFLALLSIYTLAKYLNNERTRLLLGSGLALGLCGSVRPADSLIITAVIPLLLMHTWERKNRDLSALKCAIKNCTLFTMAFLLPLLLFYLPYLTQGGAAKIMSAVNSIERAKFLGLFSQTLPLAIAYTFESFTIPGVAMSLAGLYILFLRNRRFCLFLLIWFLVLFFYHGNLSVVSHRLMIAAFVPLVIGLGYCFCALAQMSGLTKLVALLLFFTILLWLFYNLLPAVDFRHRYNLQGDFGRWVASRTEEKALIMAMDESIFIEYYAHRKTLNYPELPITCDEKVAEEFIHKYIRANLRKDIPVYVTSAGLAYDLAYCGTLSRLLKQDFIIELVGCRINEDWHHSCLKLGLYKDCLWRIREKP
ncbi:MAG: glycosyltransferase family 39 protein [Candidatus Omnitrophota bacterium]